MPKRKFPRLIPHSRLVPQCGTMYLNTNNIDIVVFFISSAPSISTAYQFANPGIYYGKLSCNNDNLIDCIRVVTSKYRGNTYNQYNIKHVANRCSYLLKKASLAQIAICSITHRGIIG